MAMNTTYLSMNTSAQSNINTPHILSGVAGFSNFSSVGTLWANDFVVRGAQTFGSAVVYSSTLSAGGAATLTSTASIGGAATLTSTASVGGLATFTSGVTVVGPLNVNSQHTQANFLSYATTASATSVVIADGAFGIYFQSVTSCRLVYRSGNTTYTWIATTGAIL